MIEFRRVALDTLVENEDNPRTIQPKRMDALRRSLAQEPEMLEARPVVALPDGRIVAGNMRVRAARELGWTDIPCAIVDLTEEQARYWLLRDNAEYGEWDEWTLDQMLREMQEKGVSLDLTGFDEAELERIMGEVAIPWEGRTTGGSRGASGETPEWEVPQTVQVVVGQFKLRCQRGDYERWQDEIRLQAGFAERDVVAEIRRRLCLP